MSVFFANLWTYDPVRKLSNHNSRIWVTGIESRLASHHKRFISVRTLSFPCDVCRCYTQEVNQTLREWAETTFTAHPPPTEDFHWAQLKKCWGVAQCCRLSSARCLFVVFLMQQDNVSFEGLNNNCQWMLYGFSEKCHWCLLLHSTCWRASFLNE